MAVHQAAMRRTGQHVPGVDTHSMGTFTEIARSLMETEKKQGGQEATRGSYKSSASACLHGNR